MNINNIMSCYCKAREAQAFYTNCLETDNLSQVDRELIYELIKQANQSSTLIRQYCYKTKA